MQLPSKNSRWESIPTQQNPRFPKNVHRAKRDPPKLVRRLSSRRSINATATTVLLQNEFDRIDQLEGKQLKSQRSKRTLLDGLVDSKFRFDRKGHPIVVVRRSTARSSCSDITFDSAFFSEAEDNHDDEEEYDEEEGYISEEQSLVDDDDEFPEDFDEEPIDDDIPRILVLALEPYNASVRVHPSRIAAQEVGKKFSKGQTEHKNVAVDTVAVLTDSQVDDDSRDDRYILAMAAMKKHVQRTKPEAVVVVTEDSLTSHVTVEGYESSVPTREATRILQELKSSNIPTTTEATYGPELCQQWVDRLYKAGLKDCPSVPIVFLHLPPFLPETAQYHYHPRMSAGTSVKGIGAAVSWLASRLEQTNEIQKQSLL